MSGKDPDAYRTISEVSDTLNVPPHVLRFWETKFPQVKPLTRGGGRRFYRRTDVDLLRTIRHLLYEDGYTIRGVQRLFKSKGTSGVLMSADAASHETPDDAQEPAHVDGPVDVTIDPGVGRALIERLAAEIAACRTLLSDALRSGPLADGRDATPQPPAGAQPDAPASAAPPP